MLPTIVFNGQTCATYIISYTSNTKTYCIKRTGIYL